MARPRQTQAQREQKIVKFEKRLKKLQAERYRMNKISLKTEHEHISIWEMDEDINRLINQIKYEHHRITKIKEETEAGRIDTTQSVFHTGRSKHCNRQVAKLHGIKPTLNKYVSFAITPEIHKWAKEEAEKHKITMSQFVFEVLNEKKLACAPTSEEGRDV